MPEPADGLNHALRYSLFDAIFNRRSRRVSKGVSVAAGSLSYRSEAAPQPLTPLEEALLIAATGVTGMPMHDLPFQTEQGVGVFGTPMLKGSGRAAGSPDNAQAAHFFLLNDSGTYFLKQPEDVDPYTFSRGQVTPEALIAYAERCKVKVLDHRLDFAREFPAYINTNKWNSNVPGSTVLVPVVDMTKQYINGFMYVLSQEEGHRPVFVDDWNFYKKAGVSRWVKNGFLNKTIPAPLGYLGTFRVPIEADMLLQNIWLAIQAMGLGGWVHAAFYAPLLLGDPEYAKLYGPGLGFRFERPKKTLRSTLLKLLTPLPAWCPNPVGLDGVLEGFCPPYYASMSDAVDALLAEKYGKGGLYSDPTQLDRVYKPGYAQRLIDEAPATRPTSLPAPRTSATTSTTPTAAFQRTSTRCMCPASGSRRITPTWGSTTSSSRADTPRPRPTINNAGTVHHDSTVHTPNRPHHRRLQRHRL